MFQDVDMIENIRNVYALPPVYILMNHCDIADEEDDEDDEDEEKEKVKIYYFLATKVKIVTAQIKSK